MIDQTQDDLKSFAQSFFSNLGCTIVNDPTGLIVSNVPPDFEHLYEKKSPYLLVFDAHVGSGELVARGSFLLKTMTSYLEQRGQTALVKLVFDHDYLTAFKKSFSFKKCELVSLTKTASYRPLYLFSFSTTLQYLNEKDKKIIVAEDSKIVGMISVMLLPRLNRTKSELYIPELVVLENRRGLGIGKSLMESCVKIAKEKKCFRIRLESGNKRKGAHQFYKKIGFEQSALSYTKIIDLDCDS